MPKKMMNGQFVEVAEGDEVIRVAEFDLYDSRSLICEVKEDFHTLMQNVSENLKREFMKKIPEEREEIMESGILTRTGGLVKINIHDMLKSKYDAKECTTESSFLFFTPKAEDGQYGKKVEKENA